MEQNQDYHSWLEALSLPSWASAFSSVAFWSRASVLSSAMALYLYASKALYWRPWAMLERSLVLTRELVLALP